MTDVAVVGAGRYGLAIGRPSRPGPGPPAPGRRRLRSGLLRSRYRRDRLPPGHRASRVPGTRAQPADPGGRPCPGPRPPLPVQRQKSVLCWRHGGAEPGAVDPIPIGNASRGAARHRGDTPAAPRLSVRDRLPDGGSVGLVATATPGAQMSDQRSVAGRHIRRRAGVVGPVAAGGPRSSRRQRVRCPGHWCGTEPGVFL